MPRPKRKDWRAGKTKKEIQAIIDKRNATRLANKKAGKDTPKIIRKKTDSVKWRKAQDEMFKIQPERSTLDPLMDLAKEVYNLSKTLGDCEVAIEARKGSLFVTITANQIDKDPIIGN